jgi:ferredoxin
VSKYKIKHDRENCIGCSACMALCPNFWEMNADGRADIIGGKRTEDEGQELEIEENDFQCNMDAAEGCPVNVIHLINIESGEELI